MTREEAEAEGAGVSHPQASQPKSSLASVDDGGEGKGAGVARRVARRQRAKRRAGSSVVLGFVFITCK
jgi:hypothetical protein